MSLGNYTYEAFNENPDPSHRPMYMKAALSFLKTDDSLDVPDIQMHFIGALLKDHGKTKPDHPYFFKILFQDYYTNHFATFF